LRLLVHCTLTAADLALLSAGSSSAAKMAMIAITTNSSISVKAFAHLDPLLKAGCARVKNRRFITGVL
jgi:hypothetical protein